MTSHAPPSGPYLQRKTLAIACVLLAVVGATSAVSYYLWTAPERALSRGKKQAEDDWQSRDAVVFRHRDQRSFIEYKGFLITSDYDNETGLRSYPVSDRRRERPEYYEAYNRTVLSLIEEHGLPSWSVKRYQVANDDLVRAKDLGSFREIDQFPYELTPNIVLFRRGTIQRWGTTSTSGDDGLSVTTPHLLYGMGDKVNPVSVGRITKYPGLVFIKDGDDAIAAMTEEGTLIASAQRHASAE